MQFPPPVHGVSIMSSFIAGSEAINEKFSCKYINLATAGRIENIQKSSLLKYFLALKIFARTLTALLSTRFDRTYITLFPFGFAFIKDSCIILLLRLFGYRPLVHLHTYGFRKASAGSGFRKKIYRFIFRNVDVICLSSLLIEDIACVYRGKIFILPNGIPQVNFKNTYANSEEPVQLLYLSNLMRQKGILILLDAVEILKKQGLRFHLRIVGPEQDITYPMLKGVVVKKGLEQEVTLVGPKFNDDKYNEFRSAGIFILPSNSDTFGLVLAEAMQFGVPCISTRIGGIPDVLGNGVGLMIPQINAQELALAIAQLLNSPAERLKMSRLGFEHFEKNFTIHQFEKNLINILNNQPERVDERLVKI